MLSVIIPYFSASFIFIGVLFYVIKHSPAGWEDERGFHVITKN
jgi:hypothetical protein